MSQIQRKPRLNSKVRRAFLWITSCGLLLNVCFDFLAYRRIDISDDSGTWINHSYEVLLKLERLDAGLDRMARPPLPQDVETLSSQAEDLKKFTADDPTQQQRLRDLQNLLHTPPKDRPLGALHDTMNKMIAQEGDLLQRRLVQDTLESQNLHHSLIQALALDLLLFLVMLFLFMIERRERLKVETNLGASLKTLREVNLALEQREEKRLISSRTIVHDIKNPLGSIYSLASLIREEPHNQATIQEFSEMISRISQTTLHLVDSLLTAPAELHMPMEQVNFVKVLEEISVQARVQAQSKNQSLILDLPTAEAHLLGNSMKLEELVFNLVGNAIKYAPPESKIWLRCHLHDESIITEIEDQGPGFTSDDKARAFQFGQVLSAKPTGAESSTGYGLFVAKQVIEAHQGQIEIHDAPSGRGALIRFVLPSQLH